MVQDAVKRAYRGSDEMHLLFRILAIAFVACAFISKVPAQEAYPARPIKIVVALPAGSGPDIRVRIIAEALGKGLGQQLVIENRPGGGGIPGAQAVVSATPDGYTLLASQSSIFTILPAQKEKLPFNPRTDLVPIGLIMSEGMMIAVSPKLKVDTLADLISKAKADPDKLVIGTNPAGSLPHMAARLIVAQTKAPIAILPYGSGGTNDAIRDIIGGRVHAVIEGITALKGAIDSGDLKRLAIMTAERVSTNPGLPTAAESVPGLRAIGWNVLAAPKGTPGAITQRLADDVRKALASPDVQRRIGEIGSPFRPLFGAELESFIDGEQKLWLPIAGQP